MVKKGRGLLKRKRGDGGSEIRRRLAILVLSEERERESDCLAFQGLQMY